MFLEGKERRSTYESLGEREINAVETFVHRSCFHNFWRLPNCHSHSKTLLWNTGNVLGFFLILYSHKYSLNQMSALGPCFATQYMYIMSYLLDSSLLIILVSRCLEDYLFGIIKC